MHGVGPSTVLGGRYAVQRRLEKLPHAERWSAHDTTLERDVVVVCFGEDDAHAPATLDAARRAAGLDNHRLVRVLDVGRSEGTAFYVEEAIAEAHTLAQVLEQGGLPAEEARRIAGETATGLEAARSRGLHHLRLTPHSVLRAPDGTIKVRGVATAAAMDSDDDLDSASAARLDAVGVVALTYAALTSRWPLPTPVPGLENAPRVVGGVAAPSEIAAGVPGDLDALCRLTLNDDQGPLSPGDFASQIAPWAPTQVVGLGGSSTRPVDDGVDRTIALPVGDLPGDGPAGRTQGNAPDRAEDRTGATTEDPAQGAAGAGGGAAPYDQDTQVFAAPGDQRTQSHPADAGAAGGAGAAGAAGAAVGSALGAAGTAAGQAAGAAAHKVGSFAKAAADKAADRKAAKEAAAERADARRISLDEALVEDSTPLDPPLPMLPQETAQTTRDQSRTVLAIVAGFLVVVMALGYWGVTKIGSGTNLGFDTPSDTVTVTGPATTVTPGETPAPTESATTEAGGEDFAILSATGFDPEGDNAERNGEAPRVFDGKTGTFWSSEGYASANLGGLKKGVGVRIDLGQVRKVSEVDLVLPDPSDVTVYVGKDRTLDNAGELGTSKGKDGDVTVKGTPVDGQYVIVWFTSVSQVGDGRFRATLAEVTVR